MLIRAHANEELGSDPDLQRRTGRRDPGPRSRATEADRSQRLRLQRPHAAYRLSARTRFTAIGSWCRCCSSWCRSIPSSAGAAFNVLSHTATGTVVGNGERAPIGSPFIASILLQSSYAFSFTAYDPYTPDPLVFLIAALVLYLWIAGSRRSTIAVMAAVGVFAKETVALIVVGAGDRGRCCRSDRPARWRWIDAGGRSRGRCCLGFHWYMDTHAGWGISRNAASNFAHRLVAGDLVEEQSVADSQGVDASSRRSDSGWLFAALGYRHAPPRSAAGARRGAADAGAGLRPDT